MTKVRKPTPTPWSLQKLLIRLRVAGLSCRGTASYEPVLLLQYRAGKPQMPARAFRDGSEFPGTGKKAGNFFR
jgi:hypothetical protein